MNKSKYICIYDDGSCSITDQKITRVQADELYDDNTDYGIVMCIPEEQAVKIAKSITKLIKNPEKYYVMDTHIIKQ